MKRTLALALCAACAHPSPAPRVTIAPASARAVAAAPAGPPHRAEVGTAPFAFHTGAPADFLRGYAVGYWGPGGARVFESPATVRHAGELRLVEVGRHALVEVPALGGFYDRDLGEAGWVTAMGGDGGRVVVRYTVRDGGADADWRAWQHGRGTPRVTSVTHMVLEVWSFERPRRPRVLFAHEYEAWANCCGSELGPAPPRVADDVVVTDTEVRLRPLKARRATRASWKETPLPGIDPVIAPWDSPRETTFALP